MWITAISPSSKSPNNLPLVGRSRPRDEILLLDGKSRPRDEGLLLDRGYRFDECDYYFGRGAVGKYSRSVAYLLIISGR